MAKYNYKMILIILCVAFIVLNIVSVDSVHAGTYDEGSGTELDPFIISDPNHMQAIGANPNGLGQAFSLDC